jgi:hypothetical protein
MRYIINTRGMNVTDIQELEDLSEWTTNLPTKTGWYWVEENGQIEIVEISGFSDKGQPQQLLEDDGGFVLKETYWDYWLGPLPAPKPPHE